jgi:hypothetical protein
VCIDRTQSPTHTCGSSHRGASPGARYVPQSLRNHREVPQPTLALTNAR